MKLSQCGISTILDVQSKLMHQVAVQTLCMMFQVCMAQEIICTRYQRMKYVHWKENAHFAVPLQWTQMLKICVFT